ncbi:YeeE/YedE family protein [Paludibacterium paludis]|uniref:YeeE/YedE family protein n=1 Tax=Paludibacterium paludis TaxID=1225769 RepID=A0A918UA28_9NEIS|nr:YeeE/YedE thiosulfate transporter family protein [Paludibacterium paludis]GGY15876.1 hypothetical protein GCM10011289_19050 [Paludibacterium paludis]
MSLDLEHFQPWLAFAGGLAIGAAAALLAALNGRIAGISGILGGLADRAGDWGWRLAFVAGLVAAPWLSPLVLPAGLALPPDRGGSFAVLILAGVLVGFGTRMASGCTSGHGVCGLARLSPRSLVAVLCFMASGFATTFIVEHLL